MNKISKNKKSDLLQLVGFKIGREEFGINILNVQEIIKLKTITKIPNSYKCMEGVINLRGRVIPVINLRTSLGLERIDETKLTRVIVTELNGKMVGFVVDEVNEVMRISGEITESPAEIIKGINSNYITAIAKLEDRLITVIDLKEIMSSNANQIQGNA